MKETTKSFLKTLFNEGEHIYAAPFGYTSKKAEDGVGWEFYYPSKNQSEVTDRDILVSINPLKGDVRNDDNVTAFRSFLVEVDEGPVNEQKKYIDDSGLPYSVCVFSGNKSLHFGIVLDHDLPTIEIWRYYAEWILKTLPKADPLTKNPSRGIRIPGPLRPGKEKFQVLVENKGRISLDRLMAYLNKHQDKKPTEQKDDSWEPIKNNMHAMAKWCQDGLRTGVFDISKGRNVTWFAVGYEFGKCGYDLETTMEAIAPFYTKEADFDEREWKYAVKNGHSKAVRKYWRSK